MGRRLIRTANIMLLALLMWLMLAPLRPARAHGDDRVLQLTTVVGDATHLTVWRAPSIPRTGEIHIVVAVSDAQGMPRADVLVQVQLTPLDWPGERVTALAYPFAEGSTSTVYVRQEAAFLIKQPGRYQVEVAVVDSAGAGGTVHFPIKIIEVPVWAKGFIYVQLMISGAFGILLLRQGQRIWLGAHKPHAQGNNIQKGGSVRANTTPKSRQILPD